MEAVLRRWFVSLLPIALSTSSTGGMRCEHLRIASEGNHGIVRPGRGFARSGTIATPPPRARLEDRRHLRCLHLLT